MNESIELTVISEIDDMVQFMVTRFPESLRGFGTLYRNDYITIESAYFPAVDNLYLYLYLWGQDDCKDDDTMWCTKIFFKIITEAIAELSSHLQMLEKFSEYMLSIGSSIDMLDIMYIDDLLFRTLDRQPHIELYNGLVIPFEKLTKYNLFGDAVPKEVVVSKRKALLLAPIGDIKMVGEYGAKIPYKYVAKEV